MTKSDTKQRRGALLNERAEQARRALWHPDLPPSELARFHDVTTAYFACMDDLALPCALPRVVDGRAGTHVTLSHVGGAARWPDGATWPSDVDGAPLTLALEVHVAELPVVPPPLAGVAVLQVFLRLEPGREDPAGRRPSEPPQYVDAWAVCAHDECPLGQRHEGAPLPEAALTFERALSYPGFPDTQDLVDRELEYAFETLPGCDAMAAERAPTILGTHVGGWPAWLNGVDVGEFVMQIDGQTLGVDLGFDGQLYVGYRDDAWAIEWEIG